MTTIRKLEKRIEKAVLELICDMGLERLPLLPSQQTMHLIEVGNDHRLADSEPLERMLKECGPS